MEAQSTIRAQAERKPLEAITGFMRRFVAFSDDDHADVLATWVLHTWAFDAAYATPYIYVHSAEPQSGKTRVLEVCEMLARNALSGDSITPAMIYRLIESRQPTLFVDEVDTVFYGAANEDLRAVLNSGYKSGRSVWRYDGGEERQFATFCPKMLVGIDTGHMPDTLRDRCIPIVLKRKKADQEVERFIPRKVEADAADLQRGIEAWAQKHIDALLDAPDAEPIDGISDRAFEIAEPLLAIAHVCGKRYESRLRAVIGRLMAGKVPKKSVGIAALEAAREIMDEAKTDRVSSKSLAAHLGVSPKKLGVVLSAYEIQPSTVRFSDGTKLKGYHRADFADAWERYM